MEKMSNTSVCLRCFNFNSKYFFVAIKLLKIKPNKTGCLKVNTN